MLVLAQVAVAVGGLWTAVHPGVWQREVQLAEHGALSVVRAIAVRFDPAVVRFTLDSATRDEQTRSDWTVQRMPADGVAAFNAGQFGGASPWGWLVQDGVELQEPGRGSLAMSFVADSSGRALLVGPNELESYRGHVAWAFQSYPALLVGDGTVPWELRAAGRGVNLSHRDSRLGICTATDASVIVVLTRYTGLGGGAPTLPWGPTVGEMVSLMRSLGCRRAMLLDGGLSSQLALRSYDGTLAQWTNWRSVPLGMIVTPRADSRTSTETTAFGRK